MLIITFLYTRRAKKMERHLKVRVQSSSAVLESTRYMYSNKFRFLLRLSEMTKALAACRYAKNQGKT